MYVCECTRGLPCLSSVREDVLNSAEIWCSREGGLQRGDEVGMGRGGREVESGGGAPLRGKGRGWAEELLQGSPERGTTFGM